MIAPVSHHRPTVLTPQEAAALIPDRARIAMTGFASAGIAQAVLDALIARHEREAAPSDLCFYHAAGHGLGWGCDRVATQPGLIGKIIGAHWGMMNHLRERMMANEIEAHNLPQGMMVRAFREMARGIKWGFQSEVGLGTYIDPRDQGGCINEKARANGSLLKLESAPDGSPILRYPHLPIDFALIRLWEADCEGNASLGMEPLSLSPLEIALATKANGGKVVCQVRSQEEERRYAANEMTIPAALIDYLVLADDPANNHRQCEAFEADPCLLVAGDPVDSTGLPPVPAGPRGWIGRRAAMEIRPGNVFNLGIGIPGDTVTAALAEAGRLHEATPTLESGVFGGVGICGANNFGVTIRPQGRIDQGAMFDFYHAGGLDITVMGAAEIAANGNINVSFFNNRPTGCGGFIDITQHTQRIIFCSTFTAGGLEAEWAGGRLRIVQEGRHQKLVPSVQQVTFSGAQALAKGLSVRLVTERCVMELGAEGWTIIEIAPGIDLERDLFAHAAFRPAVSPQLRAMDPACFGC